jgi:signal transduction histidine kinase
MRALVQSLRRAWRILGAPEPDLTLAADRVRLVERDLGLPVKAGILIAVGWFLYFSLNIEALANTSEVALEAVNSLQQFFVVYAIVTAFLALPTWAFKQIPLKVMQWIVFITALLDALFLAAVTLVTDGFDSILYWVFPVLIVRNALSMPVAPLQLLLNFLAILCYVAAGVLDLYILRLDVDALHRGEEVVARAAEPFLLRIFLLVLLGSICFSLRVLLDRERIRQVEAAEFALRQEQLRTAGRLAAEIAHQIKNPLGIINNAAFVLQRAINGAADGAALRQLEIIREEVTRSDRIITELVGFAQLAEEHVERLDVVAEIEASINRVFPPGAGFRTRIERDFLPPAPVLMFSRRALGEIFDNLLKNARDALEGGGEIRVGARYLGDFEVEVTISDNGPGIPPENRERIFEAYFTTKERGTGLGLSIVKQNVEMFGGQVRVESEVGRGTTFRILFPGRATLGGRA